MADILNKSPVELEVNVEFKIGPIQVPHSELASFAEDLKTPLTAHLVLLLPFQFSTTSPIPVYAGPEVSPGASVAPGDPPNPAMVIMKDGDLLGRDSGGGGALEDIEIRSITLKVSVVNHLGINGYISMLGKMPTVYPSDPADVLGKIYLSGDSAVRIPKDKLAPPFSPVLEIYLDGDFDINRSLPPEGAMTMDMNVTVQTGIDMTL
jgi:hypothetical protein